MKRKMTDDLLRQIFIDITYNSMTQAEAARVHGISQPLLCKHLKYYMLRAYSFDVSNPNMSVEQKADWFGLTPEQYAVLVLHAKVKLAS